MQEILDWASNWIGRHELLITVVSISSLFVFVGSLVFIPWLIIQLPTDYFTKPDRDHFNPLGEHPVAILIVNILRNIVGIVLVIAGVLLLVLPGQGLLTIIIGLLLTRFPGKRRFVSWLVGKRQVRQSMNWIRRKANKPELELRPPSDR